jgi:hypothetical protein
VQFNDQSPADKLTKLKLCIKLVITGLERGEITGEQAAMKIVELNEELKKIMAARTSQVDSTSNKKK